MAGPYRTKGITTQTASSFFVDAGAVYINLGETDERMLGATRDGNSFVIEQDVREPEIDGSPGPLVGTRRIVEVRPQLTANLLEITEENIRLAIAGSDGTAYPDATASTHTSIRRTRNIRLADYVKNVALVGTIQGSDEPIILIVYNALQTENFELGTSDRDEAVLTLTLTGHFDPADMDSEPWEIRYPNRDTAV